MSAAPRKRKIERLADEVRHLVGQVVLMYRSELVVLHGVGEDEDDVYYIARPMGANAVPEWYSASGHCDTLENHLPEEIYDGMERVFILHGGLPINLEVKFQLGNSKPAPYDPKVHPEMKRKFNDKAYRKATGEEDTDIEERTAA